MADLGFLLAALPPLVNVVRYGHVRGTDTAALAGVVDGLITRACIALPFGVRALSDDAAARLVGQIIAGDAAIRRETGGDGRALLRLHAGFISGAHGCGNQAQQCRTVGGAGRHRARVSRLAKRGPDPSDEKKPTSLLDWWVFSYN
jgi:hypothetical protein